MTEEELMKGYRNMARKRTDPIALYRRSATEDELLQTLTEALTLAGWRWTHTRRSDLAVLQGHAGWPDLFAVHPTRGLVMALECKVEGGQPTGPQVAWGAALEAASIPFRIVRPRDLDSILEVIVGKSRPDWTIDQDVVAEAIRG